MSSVKVSDLTVEQLEEMIRRVVSEMLLPKSTLTIHDLGWTPEKAFAVRNQLAAFAEDWDDPAMDVYNDL